MTDFSERLTVERLKSRVIYEPQNGSFVWASSTPGHAQAGRLAGGIDQQGYLRIKIDKHRYFGHRLAWLYVTGEWPKGILDHINGNRSDNRWQNLRLATRSQNAANSGLRATNTSGFKGVSFIRRRKLWRATICVDGEIRRIGECQTKEEAAQLYERAAINEFGEFARFR